MSTRLQVVMEDAELDEIREAAEHNRMTVSEWVRSSLREARQKGPQRDLRQKLSAIEQAAAHSFPTAEIDQMLDEIDRGRRASH